MSVARHQDDANPLAVHKRRRRRKWEALKMGRDKYELDIGPGARETRTSRSSRAARASTQMIGPRPADVSAPARSYRRPAARALILLATLQLICDIRPLTSSLAWAAQESNSDLEAEASRALGPLAAAAGDNNQADATTTTPNKQRLPLEPADVFALVGQPEARLQCAVVGKAGHLFWYRGPFVIARETEIWRDDLSRYSVTPARISPDELAALQRQQRHWQDKFANLTGDGALEPTAANQIGAAPIAASASGPSDDPDALAANGEVALSYTLRISNVSLEDDRHFHCLVDEADSQHRLIKSRRAHLHVLRPPTQLSLQVVQPPDTHLPDLGRALASPGKAGLQAQREQQDSSTAEQRPVEVRQGAKVRLECRSGEAKPRAELQWLDENQVPVRTVRPESDSDSALYDVEEFVQSVDGESGLEVASLVLTLAANLEHHDKSFTCVARHKAFALNPDGTLLQAGQPMRSLRKSVRLHVLYEPMVEISMQPRSGHEFSPIRLECSAQARPPVARYRWLLDEQLIANATGPELFVPQVTRQLQGRTFTCEAENALGATSNRSTLSVRYSPAYVTHLLPGHLLPAHYSDAVAESPPRGQQKQQPLDLSPPSGANTFARRFQQLDPRVRVELAVGAEQGANVTLRCDFDALPPPTRIEWLKVATEYSSMRDVTPKEADELIAYGANRALFKQRPAALGRSRLEAPAHHNKRHISIEHSPAQSGSTATGTSSDQSELDHDEQWEVPEPLPAVGAQPADSGQLELDFERMSHELLHELALIERHQLEQRALAAGSTVAGSQPPPESPPDQQLIESLPSEPFTQTHPKIREPLEAKFVAPRRPKTQLQTQRAGNLRPQGELLLFAGQHQRLGASSSGRANRTTRNSLLDERQAKLASSSLKLARVNGDSIGRYVCKAHAHEGYNSAAKAVFLVLRQEPRIISVREQWAPLGAQRVQVECLAQINAVLDNRTQMRWFRDDKPINVMYKFEDDANRGKSTEKGVAIIEELSPDGLFVRSSLRINNADFSDFGKYDCVIVNSAGRDEMPIYLQPSAPTGFAFKLLAVWTVGLIVLISAVLMIICAFDPCRRFGNGALIAHKSAQKIKGKSAKGEKSATAQDKSSGGGRPAQRSASLSSGHSAGSSTAKRPANGPDERPQLPSEKTTAPAPAHGHNFPVGSLRRPSSAFGPCATPAHHNCPPGSSLGYGLPRTCSFRASSSDPWQQTGATTLMGASRFAAIHESLEHKLEFGAGSPPVHNSSEADSQAARRQNDANEEAHLSGNSRVARQKPRNLIGRLKSRFQGQAELESGARRQRRVASARPTISGPLSGSQLTKHSLSNSLTHVGLYDEELRQQAHGHGKHLIMMHLNHAGDGAESQLVSSSVNLIQDSKTVSSDGATSSGRSSSSSTGQHQHQQLAHLLHNCPQESPPQAYVAQGAWPPPMANLACDTTTTLYNAQQQQQQIYANEHYQAPLNQISWDTQQVVEQRQQQQYQQAPIFMSEPYLAAAVAQVVAQQQQPRQLRYEPQLNECGQQSSYATDCNGPQANGHQFPQATDSSSPGNSTTSTTATNGTTSGNNNYAPVQFFVQTSDNGEAFYESNYGTLLSTSTAYKTLGYKSNSHGNSSASPSSGSPSSALAAAHANGAPVQQPPPLYTDNVQLYARLDVAGALPQDQLTSMTDELGGNGDKVPLKTTSLWNGPDEKTRALQESGDVVLESLAKSSLATHV